MTRDESFPATPATPILSILRLPAEWAAPTDVQDVPSHNRSEAKAPAQPLFARSEGSLAARARGNALHALLERLSLLYAEHPRTLSFEPWRPGLQRVAERILREAAFATRPAQTLAAELTSIALTVAASEVGRWLLQPHPGALTESTWQGWDADGHLRTLRVDRTFVAGETPGALDESYRWIVDYKTSSRALAFADEIARADWLAEQKEKWRGQLEAYGTALKAATVDTPQKALPIRYGLFFPELTALVSWSDETA